jgi:hypothetical protein
MPGNDHIIGEVVSNTTGVTVQGRELLENAKAPAAVLSNTPGELIAGAAILAAQEKSDPTKEKSDPTVCLLGDNYHQQTHDGTSCPVTEGYFVARMSEDRAKKIADSTPEVQQSTKKSELDALTAGIRRPLEGQEGPSR